MPVINREALYYATLKEKPFTRVINVNSDGQFWIKLPKEVETRLGVGRVDDKTRQGVIAKFNAQMEAFEAAATKKRKVIVYSLGSSAGIMRDGICVHSSDDVSFSRGMSLQLAVQVMEESEIALAGGNVRYEYEDVESSIPTSAALKDRRYEGYGERIADQLEWTQEREDWFAKIVTSMEDLILMLSKGFKTPESVTKVIETKSFPTLLG